MRMPLADYALPSADHHDALRPSGSLPRPGRLPPAALVLSALALLPASAAPSAHAQSEVILIGTVTVEEYETQGETVLGYTKSTFGALSTTHFQHQSARREVISLYSNSITSLF